MQLQKGDIFAEVYERLGEIVFVPMEGMMPGDVGYKFCGTFRYSEEKSEVKITDADCISAMERALPMFIRYLDKKLRLRYSYTA
jgi:hypothetical protein